MIERRTLLPARARELRLPPAQLTLLAEAARALFTEDYATAEARFAELYEWDERYRWVRWGRFTALAGQARWHEAHALLPTLLEEAHGTPPLIAYPASDGGLPPDAEPTWQALGAGRAEIHDGVLRLAGAHGAGVSFATDLPVLDNHAGTWIEFVMYRGPGAAGDCRLEFADGTVTETVYLDPDGVRLQSGGVTASLTTGQPHLFGLWVAGQTSRLYVDGRVVLENRGLPGEYARRLRFGLHPAAGSEAECCWGMVRVTRLPDTHAAARAASDAPPATARKLANIGTIPRALPAPWPVPVWTRVIDALCEQSNWQAAVSAATQARLAYPEDEEIRSRLGQVFRETDPTDGLDPVVDQALQLLPLTDRAVILERRHQARVGEPLMICRNVGIRFRRGAPPWRSLRSLWRSVFHPADYQAASEFFWAVRNVSLELRPGDLLGIIGRNGAGKTTLLHGLAGAIAIDTGTIQTRGKTILLSSGAGFLPALSGRQNILLSGLYLGMTRREIEARCEEIIEFAELWDAIDRPFRTYSTGMMSRLQFALATAVNPEILMLDELLGGGDAAFVEKAQTRMQLVLRRARVVVVVTHDLEFVRNNCTRAILLEKGEVVYQGIPSTAVEAYYDLLYERPKRSERGDEVVAS